MTDDVFKTGKVAITMRPIGTVSHHLTANLKGSHSRMSCCFFIPAINGRPLPRWANERQRCSI